MKKYIIVAILCIIPIAAFGWGIGLIGGGGAPAAVDWTQDADCEAAYLFADNLTDECSNYDMTIGAGGPLTYDDTMPGTLNGKMIHFDGSSQYLAAGAGVDMMTNATDYAISFWFKMDTNMAEAKAIYSQGSYFFIGFDANEELMHQVRDTDDGGGNHFWYNISDFTDSTAAVHVCLSLAAGAPGGDGTGTVYISSTSAFADLVDGTTETFVDIEGTSDGTLDSFVASYNGGELFDGSIGQLLLLRQQLTRSECSDIWQYGIDGGN